MMADMKNKHKKSRQNFTKFFSRSVMNCKGHGRNQSWSAWNYSVYVSRRETEKSTKQCALEFWVEI